MTSCRNYFIRYATPPKIIKTCAKKLKVIYNILSSNEVTVKGYNKLSVLHVDSAVAKGEANAERRLFGVNI
jgi:hypothetical protein